MKEHGEHVLCKPKAKTAKNSSINSLVLFGIAVAFNYYAGDPGVNICDLAQSWKADLIVLGRRGLKGLAEVIAGSVSNHVVYHAPCSVLIVQGETS